MIGFYTKGQARGKVIGKNIRIQERFSTVHQQCIYIRYGDADISVYARLRNTEASATDESQRAPVLLPELPVIFPWTTPHCTWHFVDWVLNRYNTWN